LSEVDQYLANPRPVRRSSWHALSRFGGVVFCLMLSVGMTGTEVSARTHPGAAKAHALLQGVSTLSRSNAWAVGYTAGPSSAGVILHWNGRAWSRQLEQMPPAGHEEGLVAISADSALNAWAVGDRGDADGGHTVAISEHWDGSAWSPVPVPRPPHAASFYLSSVVSLAPDDAWAVGNYDPTGNGDSLPLLLHWGGVRWQASAVPHPDLPRSTTLAGVAADGSGDVWAAGHTGSVRKRVSSTYVLHWDGSAWSRIKTPSHRGEINNLVSISTTGSTVWAVGEKTDQGSFGPFVEELRHGIWREVNLPDPNPFFDLRSVAAVSGSDVWIVGADETGLTKTLILNWDGQTWRRVASPDPNDQDALWGISAHRSDLAWAVGTTYRRTVHPNALTELWNGHRWTIH
jgi:hypothetical protein